MKLLPTLGIAICLITIAVSCQRELALDEKSKELYLQEGKKIVSESFATLRSHLMRHLKDGKVENAIDACHIAAYPLMDSLSLKHNVLIRRASMKVRNPENEPTATEAVMLNAYSARSRENCQSELQRTKDNKIAYFSPIFVDATCLKCHGVPGKTLALSDYNLIQQYYPQDKAINYKDGDFRGIWSVTFMTEPGELMKE